MRTSNTSPVLRAISRGAIIIVAMTGSATFAKPNEQINVSGQSVGETVTRTRAVAFGDLNLSDQHGRMRLDKRLKFASARVCDGVGATWISPPKDYTRCVSSALGSARAQVAERLASGSSADIRVASR